MGSFSNSDQLEATAWVLWWEDSARGGGYGPLAMTDKVWGVGLKPLIEPKWPGWVLNA